MDDPYKVLGLSAGAGREEVDRAYRTLVRRYPPEFNPERFAQIHDAYDRLRSFERTMEEVRKIPEAGLDSLFPVPRLTLRPFEPLGVPLQPQDLEPLLRPWRRVLLARLLRESLAQGSHPGLPDDALRARESRGFQSPEGGTG